MGVNIKDILIREKTKLESFSSKIIAIDAYNAIYQFLATIRGPEGLHLTDSKGRVTSHLTGLLYRNINFLSMGIKPVYVFDGKPPSLKTAEIERRKLGKKEAIIKYEKAKETLSYIISEMSSIETGKNIAHANRLAHQCIKNNYKDCGYW